MNVFQREIIQCACWLKVQQMDGCILEIGIFDACQINGTCGSGSGGQACQGSAPCEDGFNYYVYTYTNDNNCSVERTFTISDVETGAVVWSETMSPCNSNDFHCLFTIR